MTLTMQEREAIREFSGYSKIGAQDWRTFQARGLLEFRINYLTDTEQAVVRRYLATLEQLRRPSGDVERAEGERLFNGWRRRLCGFIGVPPGPELSEDGLREMLS